MESKIWVVANRKNKLRIENCIRRILRNKRKRIF